MSSKEWGGAQSNFGESTNYDDYGVEANTVLCEELDFSLEAESCGWGEEKGTIHSYSCEEGFIIERNLVEELDNILGYYENERRQTIYLTRLDNEIRLSGVS